jgi:hypothetical protein
MPLIYMCMVCLCSRHCRPDLTGFVPDCPVITYFTGTGYEADHQLGGAMAHARTFARTRLGYKGPVQFVTMAGDDDWLGMAQGSHIRPTCQVDQDSR